MAITIEVLVPAKQMENTLTKQYEVGVDKAIIDKCTITNTSANAVTMSIHLVSSGGTPTDANAIYKSRAIASGESFTCPAVVGHNLRSGASIHTIASAATALTLMISGRLVA